MGLKFITTLLSHLVNLKGHIHSHPLRRPVFQQYIELQLNIQFFRVQMLSKVASSRVKLLPSINLTEFRKGLLTLTLARW